MQGLFALFLCRSCHLRVWFGGLQLWLGRRWKHASFWQRQLSPRTWFGRRLWRGVEGVCFMIIDCNQIIATVFFINVVKIRAFNIFIGTETSAFTLSAFNKLCSLHQYQDIWMFGKPKSWSKIIELINCLARLGWSLKLIFVIGHHPPTTTGLCLEGEGDRRSCCWSRGLGAKVISHSSKCRFSISCEC